MWKSTGLPHRRLSKSLFPTWWLWLGHLWTNRCHQRNVIKPGSELHEWEVGSVFFLLKAESGEERLSREYQWTVSCGEFEDFRADQGKRHDYELAGAHSEPHLGGALTGLHVWEVLHSSPTSRASDSDYYPDGEEGKETPGEGDIQVGLLWLGDAAQMQAGESCSGSCEGQPWSRVFHSPRIHRIYG